MKHRVFDFRDAARQRVDPPPVVAVPVRRAEDRAAWRARRAQMEVDKVKSTPDRVRSRRHWLEFKESIAVFGFVLRLCGFYRRGVRNALDIRFNEFDLRFDDLPDEWTLPAVYIVEADRALAQLAEVVARFGLADSVRLFRRCSLCNAVLQAASAEQIFAKPVLAVNTACYWSALRDAGITDKHNGFGRLLARH